MSEGGKVLVLAGWWEGKAFKRLEATRLGKHLFVRKFLSFLIQKKAKKGNFKS
jgi:hypothetical protein